jgi:hypothetical protein
MNDSKALYSKALYFRPIPNKYRCVLTNIIPSEIAGVARAWIAKRIRRHRLVAGAGGEDVGDAVFAAMSSSRRCGL